MPRQLFYMPTISLRLSGQIQEYQILWLHWLVERSTNRHETDAANENGCGGNTTHPNRPAHFCKTIAEERLDSWCNDEALGGEDSVTSLWDGLPIRSNTVLNVMRLLRRYQHRGGYYTRRVWKAHIKWISSMKCSLMIGGATFGVWILTSRPYHTNIARVNQVVTSSDSIFCSVGELDASIVVDIRTMLSSKWFESTLGRCCTAPTFGFVEVHMLPYVFEIGFGYVYNPHICCTTIRWHERENWLSTTWTIGLRIEPCRHNARSHPVIHLLAQSCTMIGKVATTYQMRMRRVLLRNNASAGRTNKSDLY